jgi:hypothetical protein
MLDKDSFHFVREDSKKTPGINQEFSRTKKVPFINKVKLLIFDEKI